ncbi:MAG: hypothetical protein M1824_000816 [Vezdaea acicularis]|nr:MAG: hypothetical protein M1824_000816 [Vezdaea acicularis]
MFGEMSLLVQTSDPARAALGISKSVDILEHIDSLPMDDQLKAMDAIRAIESRAMLKQTPQPGLEELMTYLEKRGMRKALCTRNFDGPVNHLLNKFLPDKKFDPIITREFRPPKPDPAGILKIADAWGLEDGGNSLIMIGDSVDDMTAGNRAGAVTVLLVNDVNTHFRAHAHTDLCITKLNEVIPLLEEGFVGREE